MKNLQKYFRLLLILPPGFLAIRCLLRPGMEGDSSSLVYGARNLVTCAEQGFQMGCKGSEAFPLLQYLIAWPAIALGFNNWDAVKRMAEVSSVAFIWIAFMGYRTLSGQTRLLGRFWIFVLLTGYAITYFSSSFGEMLSAAVIFEACRRFTLREGHAATRILFLFLAGISKETAPAFAACFCLIAALPVNPRDFTSAWRQVRPALLEIATGSALAIGVNILFNLWRYGTPWNAGYLIPQFIVPATGYHASFTAGLWVSPAGGMLWFWPSLIAAIVGTIVLAYRVRKPWVALAITALLFTLTLGLGRWWSPFGWRTWGPRLCLPWLPATLFILLHTYRSNWATFIESLRPRTERIWVGILALMAIPQYSHLASGPTFGEVGRLTWIPQGCDPAAADIYTQTDSYYACLHGQVWSTSIGLLAAFDPMRGAGAFTAATLCALSLWAGIRFSPRFGSK